MLNHIIHHSTLMTHDLIHVEFIKKMILPIISKILFIFSI